MSEETLRKDFAGLAATLAKAFGCQCWICAKTRDTGRPVHCECRNAHVCFCGTA